MTEAEQPAVAQQQIEQAPDGRVEDSEALARAVANKTQERQMQVNRLATAYREETKQLMKELLKQQITWHDELQAAGVHVGLPSFQPPRGLTVRRRLSWRTAEREALKRLLFAHGVGKWKEIHTCLCATLPGFKHGAGDVEDACWQLLGELQLLRLSHEDRYYLASVMDQVADRLPLYTPGPTFKLSAVSGSFVRRLQLLEEFNMLYPAMQRSDAVAGYFRSLAAGLPPGRLPASWWDVEADVALLAGLYKHGYNNYEEIRRDPELAPAFQGFHSRQGHPDNAAAANKPPADADTDISQQSGPEVVKQSAQAKAEDTWPADDVLHHRVRQLFTVMAQAVVLAESQGLLMPLPGEGLALTERLLQLPPSASYVAAGASFFHEELWVEDADGPLEELLWIDDGYGTGDESNSEEEGMYAAAYGRGRGRRGRGRGRGRGRRTSKAERLAAEAAAFGAMVTPAHQAADDEGEDGGGGRRRHRPNSRYADHVLLPVAPAAHTVHDSQQAAVAAAAAFAGQHQPEVLGRDSGKRHKKDLLALMFVWGPPGPAQRKGASEDGDTPGGEGPADSPAAGQQESLDWQGWPGRQEFNAGLQQATDKELTAMLQELTSEMEGLIASGAKPRNAHAPTCDCVVCINRKRAEERRQKDAAAEAAAGAGEAGDTGTPTAEAAAAAADHGGDEAAAAGGPEPKQQQQQQQVKAETLTAVTASRLQERLELLSTFRAAVSRLPPGWHSMAKVAAAAKELPGWWTAVHDRDLVQGIVKHGYGNWAAMFEDDDLDFRTFAAAAGVDVDALPAPAAAAGFKGSKGTKGGAAQPEWVPDPKVLQKRCKSLVTSLKRLLARNSAVQGSSQGNKAAAAAPRRAPAPAAAGGVLAAGAAGLPAIRLGPGGMQLSAAQQQQLLSLPPNPVAAGAIAQLAQRLGSTGPPLLQALQSAAAQGNPAPLTEYLRQQQVAIQQQQRASVLGKRGAAAAGLPEGAGSGVRPAPAAAGGGGAAAASAGGRRVSDVGGGGPLTPEAALVIVRSMPLVQHNAAGAPVLPLVLSKDLMVISLGRVQPSVAAFHSSSHIFPVGYTATCTYPSAVSPGATSRYTTTIAEGSGSNTALFVVVAADAPGRQWVAATAAGVWQQIHAQVQATQQQQGVTVPPADGITQMGLTHPLVAMLIQELPGAAGCQEFRPELSAAPPPLVAAIKQHQAALQQAAARAQAGAPPPAAAAPAPAGGPPAAALQQQALAAQLLQQQQQAQRLVQAGQQAGAIPQQQQQMLQLLQQQQQRQAMQQQQQQQVQPGQQGSGSITALQQQMMVQQQQQQLMQRMSALQQQQQQQPGHPPGQ